MGVAEQRRERLARMRLYVITGDHGGEVETSRIVEAALEGGANVIQLRKKTMPMLEKYRLALALRILTREHEALLIINDHADLAIAADADGVHLGQDDLPPEAVREWTYLPDGPYESPEHLREIVLPEPIKTLGEFKVPLRLHRDVTTEITVHVTKEAE